jgi:hypothetical protein
MWLGESGLRLAHGLESLRKTHWILCPKNEIQRGPNFSKGSFASGEAMHAGEIADEEPIDSMMNRLGG